MSNKTKRPPTNGMPRYQSIMHKPEALDSADENLFMQQPINQTLGMAAVRGVAGPIKNSAGYGAGLSWDGVQSSKGAYLAGFDRNIGEYHSSRNSRTSGM